VAHHWDIFFFLCFLFFYFLQKQAINLPPTITKNKTIREDLEEIDAFFLMRQVWNGTKASLTKSRILNKTLKDSMHESKYYIN
jgi:hypothetical protein